MNIFTVGDFTLTLHPVLALALVAIIGMWLLAGLIALIGTLVLGRRAHLEHSSITEYTLPRKHFRRRD